MPTFGPIKRRELINYLRDVQKFHSFHSFLGKCQNLMEGGKGGEHTPGLVSGRSGQEGVSELTMKFHTFSRNRGK